MRIIFDNGEIADLENVHSVVVKDDMECRMLLIACHDWAEKEVEDWPLNNHQITINEYLKSKEDK